MFGIQDIRNQPPLYKVNQSIVDQEKLTVPMCDLSKERGDPSIANLVRKHYSQNSGHDGRSDEFQIQPREYLVIVRLGHSSREGQFRFARAILCHKGHEEVAP
jgi:hypothetical protein